MPSYVNKRQAQLGRQPLDLHSWWVQGELGALAWDGSAQRGPHMAFCHRTAAMPVVCPSAPMLAEFCLEQPAESDHGVYEFVCV